jgi:polyphosphate kinase
VEGIAMTPEPTTTQEPIRDVPQAPPPAVEPGDAGGLEAPELYFNRELSWIDFDDRVLQLAEDPEVPLLERAKFASIFASNLDEFFMIRVAGLHDQVDAGIADPLADGRTAGETIDEIRRRVLGLLDRQARVVRDELLPALAEHGIRVVGCAELSDAQRAAVADRFRRQIFPALTPLAVGAARPFPYISNLSLSLAVLVRDPATAHTTFARVKVPKELLPRFVEVDGAEGHVFVRLEEVIATNLESLFPGMEVVDHGSFRVTRDADFEVSDEADDLLEAVEAELRRRRFGEAVRVELDAGMNPLLREEIVKALEVEERQVYEYEGPIDLTDLTQLLALPGYAELRDPPWSPVTQPRLQGDQGRTVMPAMREADVLVHHPYDSFTTSVERFVEEAVADPDVLAIKMTVYRTTEDNPLIPALIRAAERGKQAVCLVELKARFDERANIGLARSLEEAGVHVVYGHPSLKTHAKAILVVRREGDGVRHYVHVGTGNYNPKTARLYTDFGLFTCDDGIGADVADMFNFLTGYARPTRHRKVLTAPFLLRDGILDEIEETIRAHEAGESTCIRMKMNALVDKRCIRALYRASRAGVPVELNLRSISCLRPGVPGVSENVRVVSVVGRFLEHSRIYGFRRGDHWKVYIGSADLMPRNLDTRVELVAPVEPPALRDDLLDTLDRCFADTVNAWDLHEDGTWVRRTPGHEPRSVQAELMLGHAARAAESAQAKAALEAGDLAASGDGRGRFLSGVLRPLRRERP